jgi:hypothetical protein
MTLKNQQTRIETILRRPSLIRVWRTDGSQLIGCWLPTEPTNSPTAEGGIRR